MLREIRTPNNQGKAKLVLHQVALVGLDSELADYVCQIIRKRWPNARLHLIAHNDPVQVDLRICATAPTWLDHIPTLWLWQLERTSNATQLTDTLWRAPMPMNSKRLLRAITCVFE